MGAVQEKYLCKSCWVRLCFQIGSVSLALTGFVSCKQNPVLPCPVHSGKERTSSAKETATLSITACKYHTVMSARGVLHSKRYWPKTLLFCLDRCQRVFHNFSHPRLMKGQIISMLCYRLEDLTCKTYRYQAVLSIPVPVHSCWTAMCYQCQAINQASFSWNGADQQPSGSQILLANLIRGSNDTQTQVALHCWRFWSEHFVQSSPGALSKQGAASQPHGDLQPYHTSGTCLGQG